MSTKEGLSLISPKLFPNGDRGPSFPRLRNPVQSAIHDAEVRRIPGILIED